MQGSTEGSAIKDFVLKHTLPLVGHRKPANDAKRYARRPLVVVYYSVDFSFDYRAGEAGARVLGGLGRFPPGLVPAARASRRWGSGPRCPPRGG